MFNSIFRSLPLLVVVGFVGAGGAGSSSAAEREHRKPPQAAFDACASKSAGAACEVTFREQKGSCRDFAVLFIACCRLQGIAARFVSGYIPAEAGDRQHMHAWAEVYLPGMGWQGYDPTTGGGVGERHIAVAAAADASDAGPVRGFFSGLADSEMSVELTVEMAYITTKKASSRVMRSA